MNETAQRPSVPELDDDTDVLSAALAYAGAGLYVVPVERGTKNPGSVLGSGWPTKSSRDAQVIAAWFAGTDYGVALHCGRSGVLVLDVDQPEWLPANIADAVAGAPFQSTSPDVPGRGHYVFRDEQGHGNASGIPGADIRGLNGVVMLAPSVHPSGHRYAWTVTGTLPDVPPALSDALSPSYGAVDAATDDQVSRFLADHVRADSPGLLAPVLDRFDRDTAAGASRHDAAVSCAAQMAREAVAGCYPAGEAFDALTARFTAAMARPGPGRRLDGPRARDELAGIMAWSVAQAATVDPDAKRAEIDGRTRTALDELSRPASGKRRLQLVKASDIVPDRARWAWDNRVPMGELTLIAGREGIGKSTLAYQLAADLTRGTLNGEHIGEPRNVIVAASEDSWAHTIVPRLMAAGADLERVAQIEVSTSEGYGVGLSLPDDIGATADVLRENDTALLLLDPLMSRLDGKLDSHKDMEVRHALEPLVLAAQRTGTAIVGLIHVTKATTNDPLNAIMGSRAFVAVARAVVFVITDPENDTVRLVGQPKSNLGPTNLPTLTFTLETVARVATAPDGQPIQSTRIQWGDDRSDSIRDMMESASESPANRTIVKEAADWLESYLITQGGTAVRKDIIKAGRADGFTEDQLARARRKLGMSTTAVPDKMPRQTQWSLAGVTPADVA